MQLSVANRERASLAHADLTKLSSNEGNLEEYSFTDCMMGQY